MCKYAVVMEAEVSRNEIDMETPQTVTQRYK